MEGRQTALVVGGGVVVAGGWIAYAALHRTSKVNRTVSDQLIKMSEGFSALAVAQKVAMYQRFPIYPKAYFGYFDPVTSFDVADAVWQTWLERAAQDAGVWRRLVRDLQVISDEIGERLKVDSPDWHTLLSNSVLFKPTFKLFFGSAAEGTTIGAYLTSLEAQQFWSTIVSTAMELDAAKLYRQDFWGYMVMSLKGIADEFDALPGQYAAAAAWVAEWTGEFAAGVVGGLTGGFLAGVFGSTVTPLLLTAGVLGGGAYLYTSRRGARYRQRRLNP